MLPVKLTPLKRGIDRKKPSRKHLGEVWKLAVADIETFGFRDSKFRCGSIAWTEIQGKGTFKRVETFWNDRDFFNALATFDCAYFYNLGFDSNYLRNYALESQNWMEFPISSGNTLLGLTFTSKEVPARKFTVKDLLPLSCGAGRMPLEKACESYGVEGEKFFGDYETRDEFFAHGTNEEIQRHCELDCLLTLDLMDAVGEIWWSTFHVDILGRRVFSLPSASLKAYRVSGLIPREGLVNPFQVIEINALGERTTRFFSREENFVRDSYKGGYCNAHDINKQGTVYAYDVVSEYPASARAIRCPTGKPRWVYSLEAFEKQTRKIPGFARVTAYLEVPVICGKREGKLERLVGQFTETLTSYEISSIVRLGGFIIRFHEGLVFDNYDKSGSLWKFLNRGLRMKASSTGAKRMAAKTVVNSLIGKFGQKISQESVSYEYHTLETFWKAINEGELPEVVEHKEFGENIVVTLRGMEESPETFMNVAWGSLILAHARLYLLESAHESGSIYEDTDSVKILGKPLGLLASNIAREKDSPYNRVGFWESEGVYTEFRGRAPKLYAGTLTTGEKLVRAKGVPGKLQSSLYDSILNGDQELFIREFYKYMGAAESLVARNFENKPGAFGGFRKTSKCLVPMPKLDSFGFGDPYGE